MNELTEDYSFREKLIVESKKDSGGKSKDNTHKELTAFDQIEREKQNEKIFDIDIRKQVKKHLGKVLIWTMWSFFIFIVIYLIFVVINSFDLINMRGVISMREVISIVFAFGAGSVISDRFKTFLKS